MKSGVPPADFTWAPMIPELIVSDVEKSLAFWRDLLGFRIAYERPEERFAFLDLDGAQIMLEERDTEARQWIIGALERPFGRAGRSEVGVRQCVVQDPDGYLVRLSQPLGRRMVVMENQR